jgi:hypothetical protein
MASDEKDAGFACCSAVSESPPTQQCGLGTPSYDLETRECLQKDSALSKTPRGREAAAEALGVRAAANCATLR